MLGWYPGGEWRDARGGNGRMLEEQRCSWYGHEMSLLPSESGRLLGSKKTCLKKTTSEIKHFLAWLSLRCTSSWCNITAGPALHPSLRGFKCHFPGFFGESPARENPHKRLQAGLSQEFHWAEQWRGKKEGTDGTGQECEEHRVSSRLGHRETVQNHLPGVFHLLFSSP